MQRLKYFVYNIILGLVKLHPHRPKKSTLVLIKTDEIGDYVLWRNSLPFLTKQGKFKDFHITLVGNIAWRNLFEHYDGRFVDEVIWINKNSFKTDLKYRYLKLKEIRVRGFEVCVNCIFSRSKRLDDAIAIASGATEKIGYLGDTSNQVSFEIGYDTSLYEQKFISTKVNEFEIIRNFKFVSFVAGLPTATPLLEFSEIEPLDEAIALPEKYIVVFPGSGHPSKRWNPEFFANVITEVYEQYQLTAVICGAGSDIGAFDSLIPLLSTPYINLYGKLSLRSFLSVLHNTSFLISIDTSAVHLGAATRCMVFGLFNGTHFGRFSPYPPEISNKVFSIYPNVVEIELRNTTSLPEKYRLISGVDYNLITPEKVLTIIREKFIK